MKTKHLLSLSAHLCLTTRARRLLFCLALGAAAGGLIGFMTRNHGNFTAHEWGTFTSVQGADGVLLDWRPLETSRLPKFVYDWKAPGLNCRAAGNLAFGKGAMLTLQRMETPVIYFYADEKQSVDVSVNFPQGLITEWYPQASQIGPATTPVSPVVATLDNYAHKAGAKPSFTFASLLSRPVFKDSRVRWAHVEILPSKQNPDLARSLPLDGSGSHYFTARDTDADYLRVHSLAATNPLTEHEKYIFYRGVGNFATPLRVTMSSSHVVTLANTGQEPLLHLFVLCLEERAGGFVHIDHLSAGEQRAVRIDFMEHPSPLAQLSPALSEQLAKSLTSEGLYRREAVAMVNTWKDSWFEEDGLRVLYSLPPSWTDRTLPLRLDPPPRELVRVMVGRAEVLTPALEQKLSDALVKARQGDAQAREEVLDEFKKLGRFAEPALRLATKGANPEIGQTAWMLLQAAARPAAESKSL